jgi:hypothetical protein
LVVLPVKISTILSLFSGFGAKWMYKQMLCDDLLRHGVRGMFRAGKA